MSFWRCFICLSLSTVPLSASAASRPRYGGRLAVAFVGKPPVAEPTLADTLAEAAQLSLTSGSWCEPPVELGRPTPSTFKISGIEATAVRKTLANVRAAPTPYRALVDMLRDDGSLSYPWPDLERSLCHPALRLPVHAPFTAAAAGTFAANAQAPSGRPFVDTVTVSQVDARGGQRMFSQRRVELLLGHPAEAAAGQPLPFATYLAVHPTLPSAARAAVESSIDRAALARFFAKSPAAALPGLIPGAPALSAPAKPSAQPPRTLTLLFDASLEDQRAVAGKLQVVLAPFGYTVALKALQRPELRQRWAQNDYELMLCTALLPPQKAPALAVALELGGKHGELSKLLPPLGAIGDVEARGQAALELAGKVSTTLVPLYVQGLAVQISPKVQQLSFDEYGVPRFDLLFMSAE